MTDNLSQLTDAELSEMFAVEVAGWTRDEQSVWHYKDDACVWDYLNDDFGSPAFATDANAVLPWLEKCNTYDVDYMSAEIDDDPHHYRIRVDTIPADAPTFPRAACIALIRAKRAEKQE